MIYIRCLFGRFFRPKKEAESEWAGGDLVSCSQQGQVTVHEGQMRGSVSAYNTVPPWWYLISNLVFVLLNMEA